MLDWHQPKKVQEKGRMLAGKIKDLGLLIQPLFPEYNKNVWDNCASIIAEKDDTELEPFLIELLEWTQDMNWPGAECIFKRIKKYSIKSTLDTAIKYCIETAKEQHDNNWEKTLMHLSKMTGMTKGRS